MENIIWYSIKDGKIFAKPINHTYATTSEPGQKLCKLIKKHTCLGFTIRGGKEAHIGIYISNIDHGGLAEKSGLKTGDQILNVNGHDFLDIHHQRAVNIIENYENLIIICKELQIIPLYREKWKYYPNIDKQHPSDLVYETLTDIHAHNDRLVGIDNPAYIEDDISLIHKVVPDSECGFETVSLTSTIPPMATRATTGAHFHEPFVETMANHQTFHGDEIKYKNQFSRGSNGNQLSHTNAYNGFQKQNEQNTCNNSSCNNSPMYSQVHKIKSEPSGLKRSLAVSHLDLVEDGDENGCSREVEKISESRQSLLNRDFPLLPTQESRDLPPTKRYGTFHIKNRTRDEIISRNVYNNMSLNDKYRNLYTDGFDFHGGNGPNYKISPRHNHIRGATSKAVIPTTMNDSSYPVRMNVLRDVTKFVSMSNLGQSDALNVETNLLESKRTYSMDDNFYEQPQPRTESRSSPSPRPYGPQNGRGSCDSVFSDGYANVLPNYKFAARVEQNDPQSYIVKTVAQVFEKKALISQNGINSKASNGGSGVTGNNNKSSGTQTFSSGNNRVSQMIAKFESETLLVPTTTSNNKVFFKTDQDNNNQINAIVANTNLIGNLTKTVIPVENITSRKEPPRPLKNDKGGQEDLINLQAYGKDEHARSLAQLKLKLDRLSREREPESDYFEENIYENIEIIKEYFSNKKDSNNNTSYHNLTNKAAKNLTHNSCSKSSHKDAAAEPPKMLSLEEEEEEKDQLKIAHI